MPPRAFHFFHSRIQNSSVIWTPVAFWTFRLLLVSPLPTSGALISSFFTHQGCLCLRAFALVVPPSWKAHILSSSSNLCSNALFLGRSPLVLLFKTAAISPPTSALQTPLSSSFYFLKALSPLPYHIIYLLIIVLICLLPLECKHHADRGLDFIFWSILGA